MLSILCSSFYTIPPKQTAIRNGNLIFLIDGVDEHFTKVHSNIKNIDDWLTTLLALRSVT